VHAGELPKVILAAIRLVPSIRVAWCAGLDSSGAEILPAPKATEFRIIADEDAVLAMEPLHARWLAVVRLHTPSCLDPASTVFSWLGEEIAVAIQVAAVDFASARPPA
jgi:hypothetical protein